MLSDQERAEYAARTLGSPWSHRYHLAFGLPSTWHKLCDAYDLRWNVSSVRRRLAGREQRIAAGAPSHNDHKEIGFDRALLAILEDKARALAVKPGAEIRFLWHTLHAIQQDGFVGVEIQVDFVRERLSELEVLPTE